MDLIDAIQDGCDLEEVKWRIECGADVNGEDSGGATSLWCALEHKRIDISCLLLEKGADINHRNKYGFTALMYAVLNYRVDIIRFLLNSGANVDSKNFNGHCALDYGFRNYEICRLLFWRGAKSNIYKRNTKIIEIDSVILFIYYKILPVDQLREIHTKWIS
jgi:hypothetical protein